MEVWHWHREHAAFRPLLRRDPAGHAHFKGQRPTTGRHRERVWPALSRYKDQRWRDKHRWSPHWAARYYRSIDRASRLVVLRKWFPMHPLDSRHTLICDLAQRPPRYEDFRDRTPL